MDAVLASIMLMQPLLTGPSSARCKYASLERCKISQDDHPISRSQRSQGSLGYPKSDLRNRKIANNCSSPHRILRFYAPAASNRTTFTPNMHYSTLCLTLLVLQNMTPSSLAHQALVCKPQNFVWSIFPPKA